MHSADKAIYYAAVIHNGNPFSWNFNVVATINFNTFSFTFFCSCYLTILYNILNFS